MTTSTTYPNGQVLVSSALTTAQVNILLQNLTCGMIGINPPDVSQVRIDWPTQGQPFADVGTDVCYLACTPQDVDYSRIRNVQLSQTNNPTVLTETWTYTKGWKIAWVFYGPNSEDRARQVRSAMFMEYFNDALNVSNLFPVPDPQEIVRLPQLINAEWWERADFSIVMYEAVTETIQDGVVTHLDVTVYTVQDENSIDIGA
jgi:hypothetical protein